MSRQVTAKEAAEELGVVERTVRRWIGAGNLDAEKRGGAFVIDLDAAREVLRRSRSGRTIAAVSELAELRGRYDEVSARLAATERELASERIKVGQLLAIIEAPSDASEPPAP